MPLQVTNLQTGVRAPFRVVWCGDPEDGRYRLGMELREKLDFWGDAYDPGPGD